MSFDYSELAVLADELLEEFGQPVTITTSVTGVYNPATGTAPSSVTSHEGWAALFDYGARDVNGTLIQQGDKQLLLSPNLIAPPKLDDVVTVSQVKYTIKNIKVVSPSGVPVLYECNVRA